MFVFRKIIPDLCCKSRALPISYYYTQSRKLGQESFTSGMTRLGSNHYTHLSNFLSLPLPDDKIFATYVWIDGTGINLRSKDRILNKPPCDLSAIPKWSFDGSSTGQASTENSDTQLIPVAIYKDPFRKSPHVIVLCETYDANGAPTPTNHRAQCAKVLSDINDEDPWFGIEQEYLIFDADLWPLGWPKLRGYPSIKTKFSYCGVGEHVAGRDVVEAHARACVYSGLDFGGTNAEVMKGAWEFQIGTTPGIKAADDHWLARYLLSRISEVFGVIISYHPKPMGEHHPGIGCHHNFSLKDMRSENGLALIERVCKILCDNHEKCIQNYGFGDGKENAKRLTGNFETSSYESCKWGAADRSASIRVQREVVTKKKGFLEDRRPAGDCDPYRVCTVLAQSSKNI